MKKLEPKSLLKIPLIIDFEVGRTRKTIEEVLELKKGAIIKLDDSSKNVIQMRVNTKKFANGKAMRKDGEMYIKITELLKENRGDK